MKQSKIPFNELLEIAAEQLMERELAQMPPEVLNPPPPTNEEKEVIKRMFEADTPEEQNKLLRELIHSSSKKALT